MIFEIVRVNGGLSMSNDELRVEVTALLHSFGLAFPSDAEMMGIIKITEAIHAAEPRQDNLQA